MNKFLIFFLILPVFLCHGQKRKKFRKGVVITERIASKNYTAPKSIYFAFKGDTHFVNFYKDLQSNIEKVFENSDVKIGFSYILSSNNPLKVDLENIPKTKAKHSDFQVIAAISISFIKSLDSPDVYQRKQNYNLIMETVNVKLDATVLKTILNVKSFNTIATQNKNIAGLIYKNFFSY